MTGNLVKAFGCELDYGCEESISGVWVFRRMLCLRAAYGYQR
jgi:hypothetical protein